MEEERLRCPLAGQVALGASYHPGEVQRQVVLVACLSAQIVVAVQGHDHVPQINLGIQMSWLFYGLSACALVIGFLGDGNSNMLKVSALFAIAGGVA